MKMRQNPYPPTIVDEHSGVEVPNDAHRIWNEGYYAAILDVMGMLFEGLNKVWPTAVSLIEGLVWQRKQRNP